ncbi:MAG: hypothetical protein PHI99_02420 [Syntrophales bacterium]|nr:hypothetical protein [Syntrophales bacterium]
MTTSGPDFSGATKQALAKRAAQVCSNPACRRPTSGPHSDESKAVNLGEAAHIRAARAGQARHDTNMTDEERAAISNGIWLCKECARKIDVDEAKYPVALLAQWKVLHEKWIYDGKPEPAGREILVKNGGIGGVISNEGQGIALDIHHTGKGPAERIVVAGSGVGEIITNTGPGTGKRIVSSSGGSTSEGHVIVDRPVNMAAGMMSKLVITNCDKCGRSVSFSKVIQVFAGDSEPLVSVRCPFCGGSNTI